MDLKWHEANCAATKGEKMYLPFTELYLVWMHYFSQARLCPPQAGNDSKDNPSMLLLM